MLRAAIADATIWWLPGGCDQALANAGIVQSQRVGRDRLSHDSPLAPPGITPGRAAGWPTTIMNLTILFTANREGTLAGSAFRVRRM